VITGAFLLVLQLLALFEMPCAVNGLMRVVCRLLYIPVMEQANFVGYFAVVDVAQVLCDRAHYGTVANGAHRCLVSCWDSRAVILTPLGFAAKLMPELERHQERQEDGTNRSPDGQAPFSHWYVRAKAKCYV
jgi:hypothetical protein